MAISLTPTRQNFIINVVNVLAGSILTYRRLRIVTWPIAAQVKVMKACPMSYGDWLHWWQRVATLFFTVSAYMLTLVTSTYYNLLLLCKYFGMF